MKKAAMGLLLGLAIFLTGCQRDPEESSQQNKILRIASLDDPQSFDPRLVRDLPTITFLHMFYEGLMRNDETGTSQPAIAKEVQISPDKKTYTFHLRESYWSNGTAITADDFVYSWKSVLDPHFPAPNAYQLYPIKRAKAAKEGLAPLSEVGIRAKDPRTLIVELEAPTPYFLELLATHFFLPINKEWDLLPQEKKTEQLIGNGPFSLVEWKPQNQLVAERNRHYWDGASVNLERLEVHILDENTALQMFDSGDLDWVGSPLSTLPSDALSSLREEKKLEILPAAGTYWFRINTENGPFQNAQIRRAFAMAIDRKGLVEHVLQGNEIPATGIIPPLFGLNRNSFFQDHDISQAQELFQKGLKELKIKKKNLPTIKLSYNNTLRNHKVAQAVQQQWKNVFDLPITLETSEGNFFFQKLKSKEYQLAVGSWFADIPDPINFLEIFKSRENATNNTNWENAQFIALLNRSKFAATNERRKNLLSDAEAVLMNEMPVIPLFFATFNYRKRSTIHDVYFSELGYLDFKRASMKSVG